MPPTKVRSRRASCDSCELVVINGVVCHELGCKNAWRGRLRNCRECGCLFKPKHKFQGCCSRSCARSYYGR